VLAIIALLAALLLPALSAAKRRAAQAACLNNQKQLAMGMLLYVDENGGVFPGLASLHAGFNAADWIYWRTNATLYPPVQKSPIITQMANAGGALCRCPLDRSDAVRTAQSGPPDGPYLYSYSMTGYGEGSYPGLTSAPTVNLGMSSVFTGAMPSFFKQTFVRNPTLKIMLAEEVTTTDKSENPTGAAAISDGRWMPSSDILTARHGGRADVAFADGHVEAVPWQFGNNVSNSWPGL